MNSDQQKCGILLVALVVVSIGNTLVLYKGHLLSTVGNLSFARSNDNLVTDPPNDRWHSVVNRRPNNLVFLESHPDEIEPELNTGQWLVLIYSVYNVQDVAMQRQTVKLAESLSCRVAIRPTNDFQDIPNWLPESRVQYESSGHPIWFALEDGHLLDDTSGWLSELEIRRFVEKAFHQGIETTGTNPDTDEALKK